MSTTQSIYRFSTVQLSTHHCSISQIPFLITHCSPLTSMKNLHSTSTATVTTNQPHIHTVWKLNRDNEREMKGWESLRITNWDTMFMGLTQNNMSVSDISKLIIITSEYWPRYSSDSKCAMKFTAIQLKGPRHVLIMNINIILRLHERERKNRER